MLTIRETTQREKCVRMRSKPELKGRKTHRRDRLVELSRARVPCLWKCQYFFRTLLLPRVNNIDFLPLACAAHIIPCCTACTSSLQFEPCLECQLCHETSAHLPSACGKMGVATANHTSHITHHASHITNHTSKDCGTVPTSASRSFRGTAPQ